MKTIIIFNKLAGKIKDDGTFFTYRQEKHFFRKYNGFGLSWSVIEQLKKNKVNKIIILYNRLNGETEKLETNLRKWLNNSVIHKDGLEVWQRILPLEYFEGVKCE